LQDMFGLPVLWFCRRKKKWHFYLLEIKVATLGISLWYFHVYTTPIGSFPLFFFILP
jgi:hypothetical protein